MELFSAQITKIITSYVGAHLQQAKADPRTHWKAKDTALSLLTSIAARSQTQQVGYMPLCCPPSCDKGDTIVLMIRFLYRLGSSE